MMLAISSQVVQPIKITIIKLKEIIIYRGNDKAKMPKMLTVSESGWWVYESLLFYSYNFHVWNVFEIKRLKYTYTHLK